ncbi:MAG TPA: DegT/DnrJ/EryC1/StrS family aminotransferase [Bacteroidota bacterium]|nr:DegT/DnrJ/EryC1/StrS family aminotransferase [Bacteroidota bacterium]
MRNPIQVSKPVIAPDERARVDQVLQSGMIASGKVVEEFEQKFSAYCGCKFGIATSNGTTALHAALQTLGIGKGDKVLTTPFTFIASTNSIAYCGATPVFGDIDPKTYNLDPESARAILAKQRDIKAILLVHLYGLPCDMDAFLRLKKEFGVLLIEDCAQAHGATYGGRKVGSIGDIGVFSFYATKNLTTGEGGMIVTHDESVSKCIRKLINHGRTGQYEHDILGYNYRMTNIAAAIGIGQLEKLDTNNRRRQEIAARYTREFSALPWLKVPHVPAGSTHVYHQYTLRTPRRDTFRKYLGDNQIGSFIVYPLPNCQQPLYRGTCDCDPKGDRICGNSINASAEVLSIPVHPYLTKDDIEHIVSTVKKFH